MKSIKSRKELEEKLTALGELDEITKRKIVCGLIGHSNIEKFCFGYVYCSRCEEQVGDTLGGIYDNPKQVIVGHNCATCKSNYEKLSWKDKYMCPDPFEVEPKSE